MWLASQEAPEPRNSARGVAPRVRACSSDSRMSTPAPSPIDMPARPSRNGRQGASSTARSALNPEYVISQSESDPPARARSTSPVRIAGASAPEAQAEDSVCTGPVTRRSRATASPGPLICCDDMRPRGGRAPGRTSSVK